MDETDEFKPLGKSVGSLLSGLSSRELAKTPEPITDSRDLPSISNLTHDSNLPIELISFWKGTGFNEPLLRRALTPSERGEIEERRTHLMSAIAPGDQRHYARLADAIAAMLGAFPNMQRHVEGNAEAMVASYLQVVRREPPWAIEKAALAIRQGRAGLNPSFCPTEPEFCKLVTEMVDPYRLALGKAEVFLAAPVDTIDLMKDRPTQAEIEEKLGRKIPERTNNIVQPGYAARMMADMAARKASKDGSDA